MGNRTKFVAPPPPASSAWPRCESAVTRRLDHAAEGIVEKIMPSVAENLPPKPDAIADEAPRPAITTCLVSRTSHPHHGCAAGRGPSAITAWYIRAGADAKQ